QLGYCDLDSRCLFKAATDPVNHLPLLKLRLPLLPVHSVRQELHNGNGAGAVSFHGLLRLVEHFAPLAAEFDGLPAPVFAIEDDLALRYRVDNDLRNLAVWCWWVF